MSTYGHIVLAVSTCVWCRKYTNIRVERHVAVSSSFSQPVSVKGAHTSHFRCHSRHLKLFLIPLFLLYNELIHCSGTAAVLSVMRVCVIVCVWFAGAYACMSVHSTVLLMSEELVCCAVGQHGLKSLMFNDIMSWLIFRQNSLRQFSAFARNLYTWSGASSFAPYTEY